MNEPKTLVLCTLCMCLALLTMFLIERKRFNKGTCPKCGEALEAGEDINDDGGRLWLCPHCKYMTTVTFPFIDGDED